MLEHLLGQRRGHARLLELPKHAGRQHQRLERVEAQQRRRVLARRARAPASPKNELLTSCSTLAVIDTSREISAATRATDASGRRSSVMSSRYTAGSDGSVLICDTSALSPGFDSRLLKQPGAGDRLVKHHRVDRLGEVLVRRTDRAQHFGLLGRIADQQAHGVGIQVANAGQQLGAVGARHLEVGDDHVVRLGGQRVERRLGAEAELHLPVAPVRPQHLLRAIERVGVVVDDHHA